MICDYCHKEFICQQNKHVENRYHCISYKRVTCICCSCWFKKYYDLYLDNQEKFIKEAILCYGEKEIVAEML